MMNEPGYTTKEGFENRHGQVNLGCTGEPGTDHCQYIYRLRCKHCGTVYGANGADIFQRRCPNCQDGASGL